MNQRIEKLAEQAGLEFDDDLALEPELIYYTTQTDLAKFAELIVRECMEVANTYQNRGGNCYVDDMIAKHFGVEL